jgi:hypothetical protein
VRAPQLGSWWLHRVHLLLCPIGYNGFDYKKMKNRDPVMDAKLKSRHIYEIRFSFVEPFFAAVFCAVGFKVRKLLI